MICAVQVAGLDGDRCRLSVLEVAPHKAKPRRVERIVAELDMVEALHRCVAISARISAGEHLTAEQLRAEEKTLQFDHLADTPRTKTRIANASHAGHAPALVE